MFAYDFWAVFPTGSKISWCNIYSRIATVFVGQILWENLGNWNTAVAESVHRVYRSTCMVFELLTPSSETSNLRSDGCATIPLSLLLMKYFLFITFCVLYLAVMCVVCILILSMAVFTFCLIIILRNFIVLVVLLLWLAIYRIPVWDVLIPYFRKRTLQNNVKVYQPLPAVDNRSNATIRVLRIRSGSADSKVECDLVTTGISEAHFEALSYVWGTSFISYQVIVNDELFYVTYNLYSALRQLRRERSERTIWIDAICINQFDDVEKSNQVQLMRDIYSRASNVIVWLGPATNTTLTAFAFLEDFNTSTSYLRCQSRLHGTAPTLSPHWKSTKKEVLSILSHEWFRRAWVIQEVIVAQQVNIRRGASELQWEKLYLFLNSADFREHFDSTASTFIKDIQELRAKHASDQTVAPNILDLVCRFRRQSATFGSDKIYSLLGLLRDGYNWGIRPDYGKAPETVFAEFTVSCIQQHGLFAVSVAPTAPLTEISWSRDWRVEHDTLETAKVLSSSSPPRGWSADGHCPAIFTTDISRGILSLRGFEIHEVTKVSPGRPGPANKVNLWWATLPLWEYTAGIPPNSAWDEQREAFNRTITADRFESPQDWRLNLLYRDLLAARAINDSYLSAVQDSCGRRQFFITKSGRFGLGPAYMRQNDVVVVVLGSKVPFVLRRYKVKQRNDERAELLGTPEREYFKFVGEAYCDGSMYYEGDIQKDIRQGNLKIQTFHLL